MQVGQVAHQVNIHTLLRKVFLEFIQTFQEHNKRKYVQAASHALNNSQRSIVFGMRDFLHFNPEMAQHLFQDYYKYEPIINEVLTVFMHQHEKSAQVIEEQDFEKKKEEDGKDLYEVAWDAGLGAGDNSVRDLKCEHLGKLRSFKGTVTRTSQVRPQLVVGIFKCRECGKHSKPIIQQFKYTQPKKCLTPNCDRYSWQLDVGKSTFADFQKLRVQEDPTKIPAGAMPRSIDVILRNQNTQRGQPGDIVEIIGYLCVLPDISSMIKPGQRTQITTRSHQTRGNMTEMEGVKGVHGIRELNYKLAFVTNNIIVQNNQFDQLWEQDEDQEESQKKEVWEEEKILSKVLEYMGGEELREIQKLKENPRLYEDMAQSLFPSIFGHPEIKKALLLQLLGGIHKKTKNKINIRGDINILIVGDPSSAKSQFLKCINKFVPRSVYTNGKTTSAAGLTASVTRDENGNVGIEAGALMLADNGICCIDEFDKMELKDQVAIHEAMEQQTISIAKAGVYATLNARTSILAAANPLFGRYDKSKSLKHNINLSAPIMSRFDLFFIICDESNGVTDAHLSEFIVNLHRKRQFALNPKYDHKTLRRYISVAKKVKPRISLEAAELLRKNYIEIRGKDKNSPNNSYRVTVRQLESMIRLSEAYARLSLEWQIKPHHVRQAYRLLNCSILKLEKPEVELQDEQRVAQTEKKINKLLDEQAKRKDQQKKSKSVTISHDLYSDIKRNVVELFKQKETKHKADELDDEHYLTQQDLISYLLSVNFENGSLNTTEQSEHFRRIFTAVIKKMTRDEQILMIHEDNADPNLRVLGMHPNYTG